MTRGPHTVDPITGAQAQVVSLGGHAAELAPSSSCRSESFRTAATHNDTAQSTPASSLRMATSRPFMTPRSASVRTTNYQVKHTPSLGFLLTPAPRVKTPARVPLKLAMHACGHDAHGLSSLMVR